MLRGNHACAMHAFYEYVHTCVRYSDLRPVTANVNRCLWTLHADSLLLLRLLLLLLLLLPLLLLLLLFLLSSSFPPCDLVMAWVPSDGEEQKGC